MNSYCRDLAQFENWLGITPDGNWQHITTEHVRDFAAYTYRQGKSPISVQRLLSSVRTFFKFLIRENLMETNPAQDVRAPRCAKRLPRLLDIDEISQLLHFSANTVLEKRDKAMLELFYSSGLRLSELAVLDLNNLDLTGGMASVTGKGNKERQVPIGSKAQEAISDWLRLRPVLLKAANNAVFLSKIGNRLSVRAIQNRLEFWAKKLGLDKRLYPHMLRHSFASHMLEASGDLRFVQELLGHADISTTQIYTHLNFNHLTSVYDKAHPRARRK